jgi:hypothetical protein
MEEFPVSRADIEYYRFDDKDSKSSGRKARLGRAGLSHPNALSCIADTVGNLPALNEREIRNIDIGNIERTSFPLISVGNFVATIAASLV